MKNISFLICFFGSVSFSCILAAETKILLDDCKTLQGWSFSEGREFPGAKGKLRQGELNGESGLLIDYDFSGGGLYVAAYQRRIFPSDLISISYELTASGSAVIGLRLKDGNGTWYADFSKKIKAGKNTVSFVINDNKWQTSWGKNKGKGLKTPFKEFGIVVAPLKGKGITDGPGKILIKKVTALTSVPEDEVLENVKGEDFSFSVGGWQLAGKWVGGWNFPRLFVEVSGDGNPTDLLINFPDNYRNKVFLTKLIPGKDNSFYYTPPLKNGGNPYNIYQLQLKARNNQESSVRTILIKGRLAQKLDFGYPKNSSEIIKLPAGTCAHFSYGQDVYGPFKGWHDWKTLIDLINQAGLKWIRDGVRLKQNDDGSFQVNAWNLAWIKYVYDKKIKLILVLDTNCKDSLETMVEKSLAVVRDTHKFNPVYELGNEPYNMGGWRPKYGGPWNAKGKNNETSLWAVEHLKCQNAMADAIKAKYPNVTIVGLTGMGPINYRYLDLGVSDNIEGVAEHPYTYSAPPERIPFSWGHEKRDGVRTGDREGSFRGFINDYFRKFKETGKIRSIWVTEFGFPTFVFNGKNEKGLYAGFSEESQAVYILRRFIESLTLPIAVTCQYDFIDDYGSTPFSAEANFGLIRADKSPKLSYYTVQRFCSLFGDSSYRKDEGVYC